MKFLPVLGVVLLLVGCSTTIPVNYVASPMLRGQGVVKVDKTSYAPAERGEVAANQFQSVSGALGEVYTDESVPDLIKHSLQKELVAAGFDPEGPDGVVINAQVEKFLFDWTGFSEMDLYLDVRYTVMKDGQTVYDSIVRTHKALPKAMGAESEGVRTTISSNIAELLMALRAKQII